MNSSTVNRYVILNTVSFCYIVIAAIIDSILLNSILFHRLVEGTIVSGRYGPLEYSSPSAKQRTASCIFGTVMEAIRNHEYNVRFQNGEIIPCKSSKLTVVLDEDIPPTMRNNSVNDVDDVDLDLGSDYVDSDEEDIEEEDNLEEEEGYDDEEEEDADEDLPD